MWKYEGGGEGEQVEKFEHTFTVGPCSNTQRENSIRDKYVLLYLSLLKLYLPQSTVEVDSKSPIQPIIFRTCSLVEPGSMASQKFVLFLPRSVLKYLKTAVYI
jgi:hypothetical protein